MNTHQENNLSENLKQSNREQQSILERSVLAEQANLKNYLPPFTIFVLGISLTLFFFFAVLKTEEARAREVFEEEVQHDITSAVVNGIEHDISALDDIKALFAASTFVSRQEFRLFTQHETEENPGIQALEWIPYVPHEEREGFEDAARQDGFPDFQFTERLSQGDMGSREEQEAYFPVYYLEPLEGNETALGFDLASNPARLEALNTARDSGEIVATAPITLVQEDSEQIGFIVFAPIYITGAEINTIEERRANLEGFALGVFRVGDLIEGALMGLTEENIHLIIKDVDPVMGDKTVYEHTSEDEGHHKNPPLTTSVFIDVAGRTWQLEFFATPAFIVDYKTNTPWISLASGALLTTFVSFYLYSSKKQNIRLKIQETRFRDLLENAPDAIVIFDLNGQIILVNQQAEKLFQYDRSEFLDQEFSFLLAGEDKSLFQKTSVGEDPSTETNYDVVGVRKDGSQFPIAIKINPFESEGRILINSSIRDMTEIRDAQAAMVESEARYREIFENSTDMIQSVSPDAKFIFVNDIWVKTLGYTEDEAQDMTLWDIIHPKSLDHCEMVFSQVMTGETVADFKASFLKKTGKEILIEGNIAPRIVDGQVMATHVFCRDVTESKQNQLEIERIADDLTQLIDTANALIITTDAEGKITEWNRASFETMGYTKEEMVGEYLMTLFPEEILSEQRKTIAGVLKGETLSGVNLRVLTKEGVIKVLSVNANPRFDTNGNVVGTVAVGQDITELDAYRSQLESLVEERTEELEGALEKVQEADRLKTEFLSTAAHELRTPLTSIRGFSEILLTRKLKKERRDRFLTMINEQSEGLGKIIDDLLDLTRLESGKGLDISSEPIVIREILNSISDGVLEMSPNHEFKAVIPEKLPKLIGDPTRLAQVGQNLLSNAIKYSPEGGVITIEVQTQEDHLLISIQDEGIGMTPEQLDHLFEKFYRADASNTSIGGTGLGLVISKTIVELHGGEIWAESEYNVGTKIYVKLPLDNKTKSKEKA